MQRQPSHPDAADPLAGTPYRALGRLGAGGMGEVVEAEHVALERRVVVKLLHRELAGRRDLVDRMRLEAQSLARLAHPNIVAVTDFGETAEGRPYLVMERLHGRTLAEALRSRGAFPVVEAIDLGRQALAGLGAAHAAGIIHRDVKLDNLFLCDPAPRPGQEGRDGPGSGRGAPSTLKLLDFGLAKVIPREGGGAPAPLRFPTEEGIVIGTPRFYSPEQVIGGPLDARTDVYALGAVLYALVAGKGPFDHLKRLADVMEAHRSTIPLPAGTRAVQPVPAALDAALARALAKHPDDRFASARAFADELARIAESLRPSPSMRPPAASLPAIAPRGSLASLHLPDGISDDDLTAVAMPKAGVRGVPDPPPVAPPWPRAALLLAAIVLASGAASAAATALLWPG